MFSDVFGYVHISSEHWTGVLPLDYINVNAEGGYIVCTWLIADRKEIVL